MRTATRIMVLRQSGPPERDNLIAWYRGQIDDGKLIAYRPTASHTTEQVKGSAFTGAGTGSVTGLLTTDTITAGGGTAPTCSVNETLTISADCWDVYVHRAGVLWAYWPGVAVGKTVELDASGNGHVLTALTTTTITERLDGTGTNAANDSGFNTAFSRPLSSFNQSGTSGQYYVENMIRNRTCVSCPTGLAGYTNGAYHLVCSGALGATTLTITGGDAIADAGSGRWKCVIEYSDGSLEFNIVSTVSDPTCTIVYPLTQAGPVNVWSAWDAIAGQHYSLAGVKCLAESVYNLYASDAIYDETPFSIYYSDTFAADYWIKKSPLIWQPVGGLANNMVFVQASVYNAFNGTLYFSGSRYAHRFTSTAAGHGLQITVPISDSFTGSILLSTGANTDGYEGSVSITVGGVSVYSATFGPYVREHRVDVTAATNIVVTVTRTTGGSTSVVYSIGYLRLINRTISTERLIDKDSTILLCGDSWMDSAHATGAGFKTRLEELISGDGGTGTVIDGATQGMTTRWALKWLPVYLTTYSPDICIINFFTNDNNDLTGQTFVGPDSVTYDLDVASWAEWGNNIRELIDICKSANCIPVIMLPDSTASQASTDAHQQMYTYCGIPTLTKEWLTQATTSELANALFVGNVRNKATGRGIRNVSTSVDVVALDNVAASAWVTAFTSRVLNTTDGSGKDLLLNNITAAGPLGIDATVVSGTSISDAVIKAPLGPEFQEITEWTNNASVDLATFTATARTRVGPRGVLIYDEDLSTADQDKADRYLGYVAPPLEMADNLELLDTLELT